MNEADTAKGLFSEGLKFLDSDDFKNAELCFRNTLHLLPRSIPTLNNLSIALFQQGKVAEACEFAEKAVAIDGNNIDAYLMIANCFAAEKKFAQVLVACEKVIAIDSNNAEVYCNRGYALNELSRFEEALASYDQAIALEPRFPTAHLNRGGTLNRLKRHEEALASYELALQYSPNLPEAWLGRANALFKLKRHSDALAAFDNVLQLKPDNAEAWLGRGYVFGEFKRYDEAMAAIDRALNLRPDHANAWVGRGDILVELKRSGDALAAYDRALQLKPDLADAWLGRGNVFAAIKLRDDALIAYDNALRRNSDFAAGWLGRGNVLLSLQRYDEAISAYDKAIAIEPDLNYAEGLREHAKLYICDWGNLADAYSHLLAAVKNGARVTQPFELLALPSSPADQLKCAKLYVTDRFPNSKQQLAHSMRYAHNRIRIAYLSADLRDHPVAYLMAGVFEQHDRGRFEITAISFGFDGPSKFRARLERAFDKFIDVRDKSDIDIARLLRELEIDIAVDLMGFTADSRSRIFSYRGAPIQVNYLGYPGTIGADYFNYIIADAIVLPFEQQPNFAEMIVHLPDCFVPLDSKQTVARKVPARRDEGLPERAFVFCSFCESYKITAEMFNIWMRLLRDVEESVLWLMHVNDGAVANLRREAEARGIESRRLIFAPRLRREDHLARISLADLFLNTHPVNAGATAIDALSVGLPIVSYVGEAFVQRVTASLLHAVGVPELVMQSLEDYEALALKLARHPAMLAEIKAKLVRNRDSYPLFDTARFTRHLEAAYTRMWEIGQCGEPPKSFRVEPIES